jgi:hypothetical protein
MRPRLFVTLILASCLALPHPGFAAAEKEKPQNEKVEVAPKFIWGILASTVASSVFSVFSNWLNNRILGGAPSAASLSAGSSSQCPPTENMNTAAQSADTAPSPADAASQPNTLGGAVRELKTQVVTAVIVDLANAILNPSSVSAKQFAARSNAVVGTPAEPLKVENGKANFQGVHVAIVAVDRNGKLLGFQSVNQGFRSGQRFKLRVVSTFDGLLAVENINPNGVQKRVYPPQASQVIALKAGEENFIPLAKDQFFEFTGTKGKEQLVIALRDPRAFDKAASTNPVYRRDEVYGSNLVQEVSANTYPAIFQGIQLVHE